MAGQWTGNNYVKRGTLVAGKVTIMSEREELSGWKGLISGREILLDGQLTIML